MVRQIDELIPLFKSIQGDTLILTPNQRLGRYIQSQYALFMRFQSRRAWSTLPCYPLNVWTRSLWENLQQLCYEGSDRQLLSQVQESIVWEEIIRRHSQGYELLNPRQTARVVMDAWHKLLHWQPACGLADNMQAGNILFKRWAAQYREYCDAGKLTDGSQILDVVIRAVGESRLPVPETIFMYAFDVISPLNRALLDCCEEQGARVKYFDAEKTAKVIRVEMDDEDLEIQAAARWAAFLVDNHNDTEPLKIGIVVPQLAQLRNKVERLFNNVFEPRSLLVSNPRHTSNFNISAAQALSETPPVRAALNVLQLNRGNLDIELISHILRSPFVGSELELNRRAVLDAKLRSEDSVISTGRLRGATGELIKNNKGGMTPRCPDLYRRLQVFFRLLESRRKLPGEWAGIFAEQLDVLGWPGDRSLDTVEFQQIRHWREVLENLSGLDSVCGPCDVTTILSYLDTLAFQVPFHARSAESPVQILGLLEAAGMLFDHVWVMHMDNRNWPMTPEPNPYISVRRQVEWRMPNASVDVELQYAGTLTERLAGSADQVIFSHSRYHEDQALRCSPLIEAYDKVSIEQLSLIEPVDYSKFLHTEGIQNVIDNHAPGISGHETIRGGTQVLKDQAACPFRAFAVHRLQATEIGQVLPGINPLERGVLIHNALDIIWRKLHKQDRLLVSSDEELVNLINYAVDESFSSLFTAGKIGKRLRSLESARMFDLIRAWLELEKQRESFTVIFSESDSELDLAGLSIKVRYDRVDELEDGGLFVIDYKTGRPDIPGWAGARPDEPQVPVYCIANKGRVTGAAFGLLNAGELGFRGIAESGTIAPGVRRPDSVSKLELPAEWQEIVSHWQVVLEGLAGEFREGVAKVDPKKGAQTCRYCSLPGLCRIREHLTGADEYETEPGSSDAG